MQVFRKTTRLFPLTIFFVAFLFSGCAHWVDSRYPFDFREFQDSPLPVDAACWLKGGEQSIITQRIEAEAGKIYGKNRRERLFRAMRHVWQYFSYDRWLNALKFTRTADELYENRVLGGCSDYALAEIAMFRALGIPSRIVVTANVDWIYQYRQDDLAMAEGHSFIEVFLEDRWYLVDSTYRWLFSDYDPGRPSYPHGEYFCRRGKDFWYMGLKDGEDLDRILGERALNYPEDFEDPGYPKYPI
jgi:transglutaminase-like putative cysteine protease